MCKNDRRCYKVAKAILFVLALTIAPLSYGQSLSYHVYFRVGKTEIDEKYMGNAQVVQCIDSILRSGNIVGIEIKALSSPEGGSLLNQKLSEQRAESLKAYILKSHPDIPLEKISAEGAGVNWQGLRDVVDGSEMKYREKVLYIIDNVPDKIIGNTSRKKQLMDLGGGNAWRYMEKEFFPALRIGMSAIEISLPVETVPEIEKVVEKPKEDMPPAKDTLPAQETAVIPPVVPTQSEEVRSARPFLMAVKTNMLYDAALTPNLAVEFYLGRGWSIEGEFNYAWWKFNSRRFHRIEWGGIEMRRWFGGVNQPSPLSGWFIGAYGMAGNYDIMYGSTGQKSSRSGTKLRENSGLHDLTYSAGVSGGYSMPIGNRLNLEFELGLGYLWGTYDTYNYDPEYNDYHYIDTKKRRYFGPTKVEISLSWLIGNGYKAKTKGGKK